MSARLLLARAALPAALLALLALGGCGKAEPRARVASTNSYLACAAGEFLPAGERVLPLTSAGACPGHFAIKPSHISSLRGCEVLLRFDFQSALDDHLASMRESGLRIAAISAGEGLCVPGNYLSACREVSEALIAVGLAERAPAQRRLAEIERRLNELDRQAKGMVAEAGLSGAAVLASGHQVAFCRYLGLKVVGSFSPVDAARTSQIEQCLTGARAEPNGVRCVVGNRQEGSAGADGLAGHLGVPVVMFSNFPLTADDPQGFDALVLANLAALMKVR